MLAIEMWATFDPSETRPFCINKITISIIAVQAVGVTLFSLLTILVIFFLRNVFALLEEKKHLTVYQLEFNNMLQCTTPFTNKLFPFPL